MKRNIAGLILSGLMVVLLIACEEIDAGAGAPPETITLEDGVTYTVIVEESDFDKIRTDPTGNYYLWRDIALTGDFEPIAPDTNTSQLFFQGDPFTGIFEGNNKTISNLRIVKSGEEYVGLFGQIGVDGASNPDANGVVRNLTLVLADGSENNPSLQGTSVVGALAGVSYGKIEAVGVLGGFVTGTGKYVGGLVGVGGGDITSSYATGSVKGDNYVGGLVGWNDDSITSSYATGEVKGSISVGGLVGYANGGSITSSYFDTSITGTNQTQGGIGNNPDHTGVTGYDWSNGTLQHNGVAVTQSDFVDWIFDGDDAVWRWVADGQWPLLAWQ